jgi:hypothetical protein
MPLSITDYIASIQGHSDTNVAFVQSTTIFVEGSINTFRSSNAEFLDFDKGDYFIVSGTENNDGVYEKANGPGAYELKAKSPFSGESVNLTTENCSGQVVVFNEVSAIGRGSGIAPKLESNGYGLMGVVGSAAVSAPAAQASAAGTSGIHGRCTSSSLAASASGDQENFGRVTAPSLAASASGISGYRGTVDLPSVKIQATGEVSTAHAKLELNAPWVSATDKDHVEKTFWASGSATLSPLHGGSYTDGRADLPTLKVSAEIYRDAKGSCYLQAVEAKGLSIGNVGAMTTASFQAQASGISGARGTCNLPSLEAQSSRGAHGGGALLALKAKAYDDSWPDHVLASGSCWLPELDCEGEVSKPPKDVSGSGKATMLAVTGAAHAFAHILATCEGRVRPLVATGVGLRGKIEQAAGNLPVLEVKGEASIKPVGNGDATISALKMMARVLSREGGYPLLEYEEDGDNWTWQS